MDRRNFFKTAGLGFGIYYLLPDDIIAKASAMANNKGKIIAVNAVLNGENIGITLPHEHLLVDFTGADRYNPSQWDLAEAKKIIKPYLDEIKSLGCSTLIDCTPEYLGRDPLLLKELSISSGINILTNTGFYGAQKNKFLPIQVYSEPEEKIAEGWINEYEKGINNTGIKPGFIKIGVDEGKLSMIHKKLIKAAAITHLHTGMTIASHTGGSIAAFEQLEILKEFKVDPSAFIWVHSQVEKEDIKRLDAARMGAWISLDGLSDNNVDQYVIMIESFKQNNLLDKVLVSHDAGWYRPGEINGGEFRGYSTLFKKLIPSFKQSEWSETDIERIIIKNPADAFSIKVRKLK